MQKNKACDIQNEVNVHSFETMAALDGPGVRLAVFLQGCPLKCAYCHNPDTQAIGQGEKFTPIELYKKIIRYKPYFGTTGGVTFSGGEPFLQAKQLLEVVELLQKDNINIAFDTCGNIINKDVLQILSKKPLLLLDIKMPDQQRYDKYIKGSLQKALQMLQNAQENGCKVWIRYVVLKGVNDSKNDLEIVLDMMKNYDCIEKIELLAYHSMGVPKYEKLGIPYTLSKDNEPTEKEIESLQNFVNQAFK